MKKKLILLPLILGLVYIFGSSYSGGPASSFVDGCGATSTTGCNTGSCHAVNASTTVAIELDTVGGTPVTTYVAGGVYTVKITGVNTSTASLPRFGWQLSSVRLVGAGTGAAVYAGTLATTGLPASTHNVTIGAGTIHYVEQTAATPATTLVGTGVSGTTYVRSIGWTPPVAGTGTVKFCGVVNAVNFDGGTSGDRYNMGSLTVPERVAPITGTLTVCVGSDVTLSDLTTGGTWSSGTTSVATISATGVVHGVAPGTTVISYNAGTSGTATATVTVVGPPAAGAIVGGATICAGSTLSLTNPTGATGGTWSTTTPAIISVNSTTGFVTGLSAGTAQVTYSVTSACGTSTTNTSFTVNALPLAGVLVSVDSICVGSITTITQSSGTTGGTWSSSATAVATVNSSTGVVSAVSPGFATISYTVTSSCGTDVVTRVIHINGISDAGAISGLATVCPGGTTSLVTTGGSGGVWTSSTTSVATVNSATGVVTGVGGGTTVITYTLSGFCNIDTATYTITGAALPAVDFISGPTSLCIGTTTTLRDPVAGGTWTIASPSIATVTAAAGDSAIITGLSAGSTTISYSASNACGVATTTRVLTVDAPIVPGTLTGPLTPCPGTAITYTYTGSIGTGTTPRWHTSNPSVATIGFSTGTGTALAPGTTTISMALENACSQDSVTLPITVLTPPDAGTIAGVSALCVGSSVTLTSTATGGTWGSSFPAVATVSASGVVTALSAGPVIIYYDVVNSCGSSTAVDTIFVSNPPTAGTILGATSVCVASSITLTNAIPGGTWTSGSPTIATINSSGVVTGISSGSAIITYTVSNICGSAATTLTVTVNPLPVAGSITGAGSVCVGASISLADIVTGGTWSSGATAIATVNASGVVSGVSAGTVLISYSVTNVCGTASAIHTVVVNGPPSAGTISGSAFVCIGTSSTLTDGVSGGTWSSSDPSIVTISPAGVATGIAIGTATISYSVTGACGTGVAIYTVSSGLSASAGTITGPAAVCVGATISLTDLVSGGVWSSSFPSIATVNALGRVTGVSAGITTISYTVTNSCGTATAIHDVTVNPLPVAGVISGPVNVCVGGSVALTETVTGGVWSSTVPSVATIDASGNVTGVSPGTFIAVYTVTTACGTVTALHTMISTPMPVLATISGASSLCQGTSIVLSASVAGGVWSASNSTASVSAGGVVTGLSYGIDTIYYTTANVCDTMIASFIDTIYPTSLGAGIIGSNILCIGDTFHYAASVPGGVWTLTNGNALIDTANSNLIPTTAGADTLTYTLTNVCGTSSASMAITVYTAADCATLGVNGNTSLKEVRIYPNPTDGIFTLELPQLSVDATVVITDVLGKVIETRSIDKSNNKTVFNLSSLAAGSYIIKVSAGELTFRDKIVIW